MGEGFSSALAEVTSSVGTATNALLAGNMALNLILSASL